MFFYSIIWLSVLFFSRNVHTEQGTCNADKKSISCPSTFNEEKFSDHLEKRYILYEVNPGEGFNLRRDVYMRIARLVKKLNDDSESQKWILVLPPWGPLYHWKTKSIGFQAQIKWSAFFDVPSLAEYVPVIEFEDFLNDHGPDIDVVYYLQHYAEGWENGEWKERAHIRECTESTPYERLENDKYAGWFWGFEDVVSKEFHCLSIEGYSSTLKTFIRPSNAMAIMIDRAEVILHDTFGDSEYWKVRRSMVFSKELTDIGDSFRKEFLNSTDEQDKTDKRNYDSAKRSAVGGPYIGVHLRRRDFAHSRSKDVPSVKHAADQILKLMQNLKLQLVFVATDAPNSEFKEFQQYIPSAVRFIPDKSLHKRILDGGRAIVDQWICAHARYFIGTYESTFSFRIQEERELLGFPVDTTFNRLCGDNQTHCQQPSKWTIV